MTVPPIPLVNTCAAEPFPPHTGEVVSGYPLATPDSARRTTMAPSAHTLTALDRLIDEAHAAWACGCPDCGRLGWQAGVTADGKTFWVAYVRDDGKRVECAGDTWEEAARRLVDQEFDDPPYPR